MASPKKLWKKIINLEKKLTSLEKFLREEAILLSKKDFFSCQRKLERENNQGFPLPGEYIFDQEKGEFKEKDNNIYHFYF